MRYAEYRGMELEEAYAKVLGGKVHGGIRDCGKDVIDINHPSIKVVQVKSSLKAACFFLAVSASIKKFVPVCVGPPDKNAQVVFESLEKYGIWIGLDIPNKEEKLKKMKEMLQQYH